MIQFLKNLFKSKDPVPSTSTAETKVNAVNSAPYKVEPPVSEVAAKVLAAPVVKSAPAKKRTFVKQEQGGTAKVAPIKAKTPAKPAAKTTSKSPRGNKAAK